MGKLRTRMWQLEALGVLGFTNVRVTCYKRHVPLDVQAYHAWGRSEQALAPAVDLKWQPDVDDPALQTEPALITPLQHGQPGNRMQDVGIGVKARAGSPGI